MIWVSENGTCLFDDTTTHKLHAIEYINTFQVQTPNGDGSEIVQDGVPDCTQVMSHVHRCNVVGGHCYQESTSEKLRRRKRQDERRLF